MATPLLRLTIRGTEDIQAAARQLHAAGRGDLVDQLRREIKQAAGPAVTDAKAAARSMTIWGVKNPRIVGPRRDRRASGSTGLRRRIAASIEGDALTGRAPGARIHSRPSRMPSGQESLPGNTDTGRWRHPVFGLRKVWSTQRARPWFFAAIRPHFPKFRAACVAAMDRVLNKIAS